MSYLSDLADVCRAAGLTVIEVDGWRTRTRRSDPAGYSAGRPTHVMVHHTASPPRTDGQPDVNYIVAGSPNAPVANLYLDRRGRVWVCAAGVTNTNGSGSAPWAAGLVADNDMNRHAVAIEAANTGVGEPWPTVQQDAYITLCAALCRAYGIPTDRVRGHFEWAPGRKIDPAGPSRWAPNGGTWPMAAFRADVAAELVAPPTPSPRSRPMWVICRNRNTGVYHVSDGVWRRSVGTNPDPIIWASVASGYPLRDAATGKQVGQASDVTDVDAPFIEGLGVVAREVPR